MKKKKKRQIGIKRVFVVTSQPGFDWDEVDKWMEREKFPDSASMIRCAILKAMTAYGQRQA